MQVNLLPEGIVGWWRVRRAKRRCGRYRRGRPAALAPVLRLEPLRVDGAQRLYEVVVERHAPRRSTLRVLRAAAATARRTAF